LVKAVSVNRVDILLLSPAARGTTTLPASGGEVPAGNGSCGPGNFATDLWSPDGIAAQWRNRCFCYTFRGSFPYACARIRFRFPGYRSGGSKAIWVL